MWCGVGHTCQYILYSLFFILDCWISLPSHKLKIICLLRQQLRLGCHATIESNVD